MLAGRRDAKEPVFKAEKRGDIQGCVTLEPLERGDAVLIDGGRVADQSDPAAAQPAAVMLQEGFNAGLEMPFHG
jgi:hypothetical protein